MANKERPSLVPDFSLRLAGALNSWAESHATPDKPCMGYVIDGEQVRFTPRQYAHEIKSETPFGKKRIGHYLLLTEDPTGEEIVRIYSNMAENQRTGVYKSLRPEID